MTAVAVCFVVVAFPHRHKVAARQADHIRVMLIIDGGGVELQRPVYLGATGVELLGVNAVAAVGRRANAVPGHYKTAVGQGGDVRGSAVVGQIVAVGHRELATDRYPCGGVDLPAYAVVRVVLPDHHHLAVAEHRYVGVMLLSRSGGVDFELSSSQRAVVGITLGINAESAAVLGIRRPHSDKPGLVSSGVEVVLQSRQVGRVLLVGQVGVDQKVATDGGAVGCITLGIGAITAGVAIRIGPGDDEGAVGQAECSRMGLVVYGEHRYAELAACGTA